MSRSYTVSPENGWRPGDRAYCGQGSMATQPTLEVGKVYTVSAVQARPNMVDDALTLEGVRLPEGRAGLYGSRFLRLPAGRPALREVDRFTTRSWSDAYRISTGQMPRPA